MRECVNIVNGEGGECVNGLTPIPFAPRCRGGRYTHSPHSLISRLHAFTYNARMNPPFKSVGLIGKYKSPEISEPLLKLGDFLAQRGVKVLSDRLTASHIGASKYQVLTLEEIGREADLAIVLGGDGTMLNIARTLAPFDVALVGVNQGRLGFLTDISIDTMFETIGTILEGRYVTEERMLLEAEVFSREKSVFKVLAFNDAVVSKGIKGSMI